MKICVLGTRGFPNVEGGVETHCHALYSTLTETAGNSIIVYRRKPYVSPNDRVEGIQFVDLPSTKIKGFEAVLHSFLATVHAAFTRPDIVHIHNIGPALFSPILKLFNIKVVLTYHSANYEHSKWGSFAQKLLRLSEKLAFSCADRIIYVNRFQMEKAPEQVRKKSIYIPNGIAPPIITDNTDYLERIGLEAGKYVLSVGRITPEKGFDTLIKAFTSTMPEGIKLVIAGSVGTEQAYMQSLLKLAEATPVVFPGYVRGEPLAQLYSNAALYVLSSNNEGFPLVLLESMSYGRDVLVSDIPATRLFTLDEEDYFPVGDHESLGKKLMERLSSNSHSRCYELDEYNWQQIAAQVLEIYCEAAE